MDDADRTEPADRPPSPAEAAARVAGLLRAAYNELADLGASRAAAEPRAPTTRPVAVEFGPAAHVLLVTPEAEQKGYSP